MAATTSSAGASGASGWDPRRIRDTPLGHELRELARRILGPGPAAHEAAMAAFAEPSSDRLEVIGRTTTECRRRDGESVALPPLRTDTLNGAVAAELERANAGLPQRQREALALRELMRLSYLQIGAVMGLETPAVASLLARSRIKLREELRGPYAHETAPCVEREHALRVLSKRQDSEPVGASDDAWIFAHMADCPGCERAHAIMLEASVRYRAWVRQ